MRVLQGDAFHRFPRYPRRKKARCGADLEHAAADNNNTSTSGVSIDAAGLFTRAASSPPIDDDMLVKHSVSHGEHMVNVYNEYFQFILRGLGNKSQYRRPARRTTDGGIIFKYR